MTTLTALPVPLCLTAWPVTICLCGADLGAPLGVLVHVDTCPECRNHPGRCPRRAEHAACPLPEAVECLHPGCHGPHSIDSAACALDHDFCCGCCHQEA